jgi:hypothetical protein
LIQAEVISLQKKLSEELDVEFSKVLLALKNTASQALGGKTDYIE